MPVPSLETGEPAIVGDKRVRVDGVAVDGRIMRLARPAVGVPPGMVVALALPARCGGGGDVTEDQPGAPRLEASGAA